MLLVGMGIGWWILGKLEAKRIVPVAVSSSIGIVTGVLPTQTTFDVNNNLVQTVEVTGVVQKWFPDTGVIEFFKDKKMLTATVDPALAVIFVPSKKTQNKVLKITSKSSVQWPTAFCQGDVVSLRLAGDKVILADNGGNRSCDNTGE